MRSKAGPAPSSDVILDLIILIVVAAAVFIGYRYGTIQPVFGFLGFGLVLLIGIGRWAAYSGFLNQRFHSNGVIDGVVLVLLAGIIGYGAWRLGGFIHRMPVIRGVDGLIGVVVCGLVAIWLLYGVISLAVALGQGFDSTIGQTTTTEAQAQAIGTWVEGNPILGHLISASDVRGLEAAAKQPNNPGSAISNFSTLEQMQSIYRVFCQPELQSSRLAPIVLWIGQHTPIIGHVGPGDLPQAQPPAPSPSPSPTPG